MLTSEQEVDQFLDDWTTALRSGDYRQGVGWLRTDDDEFCCLGVACEVLGLESRNQDGKYRYYVGTESSPAYLPPSIAQAIEYAYPHLVEGNLELNVPSLIYYNDNEGFDFSQIADVIDERRGIK